MVYVKNPLLTKKCVNCDAEFQTNRVNAQYCEKCRKEHDKKPILIEKTCPVCNVKFFDWRRKYCTEKCFIESIRRKELERQIEKPELICLWCHETFKTKYTNFANFCCVEHGQFYRKAQKRIFMRYPFDHEKEAQAQAKLEREGENFVFEGEINELQSAK